MSTPPRHWYQRSDLERTACAAVLLSALKKLHKTCLDMDCERQAARPSEAQYQRTMRIAADAIATAEGRR